MTDKIADVSWVVITLRKGRLFFNEGRLLSPLRWQKPKTVVIGEVVDLFHESVPDEWIDRVFAVMALAPRHTFQVLTKRSNRMREYLTGAPWGAIEDAADEILTDGSPFHVPDTLDRAQAATAINRRPLPNVWLGVTAEDQTRADERIPDLLATPAAKRFVSIEPMLGPVDPQKLKKNSSEYWDGLTGEIWRAGAGSISSETWRGGNKLDLVIAGGESGQGASPMHPNWPRSLRDQCKAAGVPFFFKQWGEWVPTPNIINDTLEAYRARGGRDTMFYPDGSAMELVGKRRAGRLLDGEEHNGEV